MDNSTQENSDIIRYLDNEMDEEERSDFEQRLRTDATLKGEYERLLLATKAIKEHGLRQEIKRLHPQMMKQVAYRPSRYRVIRISLSIAASVLLILLFIEGYRFFNTDAEQLFASKYMAYEVPVTRSGNAINDSIHLAYQQADYSEVIRLYGQMDAASDSAVFLAAMAGMQTGDYEFATDLLKQLTQPGGDAEKRPHFYESQFYLSLALVRIGSFKEAADLMERISNYQHHPYQDYFNAGYIRRVRMQSWKE